MGTWPGHKAKFVRRFADLKSAREAGLKNYANAVRDGSFPTEDTESYTMDKLEWARFIEQEGEHQG
jgi:3-methyl-2-oxobutanoate hydroxymethyltransferase